MFNSGDVQYRGRGISRRYNLPGVYGSDGKDSGRMHLCWVQLRELQLMKFWTMEELEGAFNRVKSINVRNVIQGTTYSHNPNFRRFRSFSHAATVRRE